MPSACNPHAIDHAISMQSVMPSACKPEVVIGQSACPQGAALTLIAASSSRQSSVSLFRIPIIRPIFRLMVFTLTGPDQCVSSRRRSMMPEPKPPPTCRKPAQRRVMITSPLALLSTAFGMAESTLIRVRQRNRASACNEGGHQTRQRNRASACNEGRHQTLIRVRQRNRHAMREAISGNQWQSNPTCSGSSTR